MLDIGMAELGVVGIVALIVIGPKRLPAVIKRCQSWIREMRNVWVSIKQQAETTLQQETRDADESSNKENTSRKP